MTKEEIGHVLKGLRIQSGMTQKEVAETIGRKQQVIGHWETGYSQPDADTLFVLCELYKTSVDTAFGFTKFGAKKTFPTGGATMGIEKINEMRKRSGLSIDQLCALSGVPKGTLSKINAGITKAPAIETVKAIVHAMGYTLDDLDDEIDIKKAPPSEDEDAVIKPFDKIGLIQQLTELPEDKVQSLRDYLAFLIYQARQEKEE